MYVCPHVPRAPLRPVRPYLLLQLRRDLMRKNFHETPGVFHFAKSLDTSDIEDIDAFFQVRRTHARVLL